MRRLKNAIIPMLLLAGLIWGLCPSMPAVRTAHAGQTDAGTSSSDMEKGDVPQPAASDDDDTESEPMPLTDADVAVQTSQVPDDAIASGTAGTCLFYITPDLEMVVTPSDGTSGVLPEGSKNTDWPWYRYAAYITTIRFDKGVKTGKTLEWAFSNGSADANAYNRLESVDFTNLDATSLTSMKGILAYDATLATVDMNMLNADGIAVMNSAFFWDENLTGLDLTSIGDAKLADVGGLCSFCHSLQTVTTGWTMRNVTTAWSMFYDCFNLTQIDAQNWRFGKVNGIANIMRACRKLETLDVSQWDVSNATTSAYAFYQCYGLKTLDLSGWNTANVTDMNHMFALDSNLTQLDVSGWDTGKVTTFGGMFDGCANLTQLDVSGWNTRNVTNMCNMFRYCRLLATLDVSGWDTGKVTTFGGMFNECWKLTQLDVSGWNTRNVTNMCNMFRYCRLLATLDVSGWDTGKVTTFGGMFNECWKLTQLDVSGWNTRNVTNMCNMFRYCRLLATLDVSGWNTGKVRDMNSMFCECSKLTVLNIGKWDTSNTTNTRQMFAGCSQLTALDVAGWDTSRVTYFDSMFNGCSKLKELAVSHWNTANATSLSGMFSGCSKLAVLDLDGWDTSHVTTISSMFYGCHGLQRVELADWNTSNMTDMSYVFHETWLSRNPDMSRWDTSHVTTMREMFVNAGLSGTLDLTGWNTDNVADAAGMFQLNGNLTRILVSDKWTNAGFIHDTNVFKDCQRLVGDDGRGLAYDAAKTSGEYATPHTGYLTSTTESKKRHVVTYLDWNGNTITARSIQDGTSGADIGLDATTWLGDPQANFDPQSSTKHGREQQERDWADWQYHTYAGQLTVKVEAKMNCTQANYTCYAGIYDRNDIGENLEWHYTLNCPKGESCPLKTGYENLGITNHRHTAWSAIGGCPWSGCGTAYFPYQQYTQVDPVTHRSLARDGYTFTGWSKDVSHVTGDMTVQARYEPARYTVDYDANGGTGSMPASTLTYDSPQALSAIGFTKAGYSFTGWNTRKDGSGKTFTDKQTVSNLLTHEGASGTLYAQWTPTPPIVTVIFHVNNGGSDETVKRVWASNNLEMKTIGLPSGWSNSGFAFRGWNLKADGTGVEYEAGETLHGRLTAETTDLYADWNGLQTRLPDTGGILRRSLAGLLLAGGGLAVWARGRRRRTQ